jgi:hypothetical protein
VAGIVTGSLLIAAFPAYAPWKPIAVVALAEAGSRGPRRERPLGVELRQLSR